jgi:hypothetical protein
MLVCELIDILKNCDISAEVFVATDSDLMPLKSVTELKTSPTTFNKKDKVTLEG